MFPSLNVHKKSQSTKTQMSFTATPIGIAFVLQQASSFFRHISQEPPQLKAIENNSENMNSNIHWKNQNNHDYSIAFKNEWFW